MFYGSIPKDVQMILADTVKNWGCSDIYVGCSGNFTVEKLIAPLRKFNLHSNDVTLYSYCLGHYFSGNPFKVALSEYGESEIAWIKDYLKTPVDCLASIMLMSNIARYFDRGDNEYYARMRRAYISQFSALHSQTVEKISRSELHLSDYFNGDAIQFVENINDDVGFITYPPFKKAGSAYVKDFSRLDTLFDFEYPNYTTFDEDKLLKYFEIVSRKKYWFIGTDINLPVPFNQYLKAVSKTTNRAVKIYLYSNTGKTRYIGPHQDTVSLKIERLMPGDVVGENIELKILDKIAFLTLRSEYMNINIRPGSSTLSIAVMVDGKLCGVYAFATPPSHANWDTLIDTPFIYMLSDFPVEPVDYDRLAKLVLYAALSKESQILAEQITRRRIRSLVTTAYSKNPVSMKYRGLFKILNRKENRALNEEWSKDIDPSNAYYSQKYELNYGAKMGEWSLAEGLQLWKKKHSQRTGKKELN